MREKKKIINLVTLPIMFFTSRARANRKLRNSLCPVAMGCRNLSARLLSSHTFCGFTAVCVNYFQID